MGGGWQEPSEDLSRLLGSRDRSPRLSAGPMRPVRHRMVRCDDDVGGSKRPHRACRCGRKDGYNDDGAEKTLENLSVWRRCFRRTGPRPLFTLHRTLRPPVLFNPSAPPVAPGAVALPRESPMRLVPLAVVDRRLPRHRLGCLRTFGHRHRLPPHGIGITRFRIHACVHSARYHTRRLPIEAAVGRHGSGTGWFDRRRALDRRRRKATELALDEPGKSNRTAIVQVRTDDLHPDREAVLASTVGHCRRG